MKLAIRRLESRQGAKHAKFRKEKINYLEKNVYYSSPNFAAFASLREIIRDSVAASPRWGQRKLVKYFLMRGSLEV
jgi:hypothetical protein